MTIHRPRRYACLALAAVLTVSFPASVDAQGNKWNVYGWHAIDNGPFGMPGNNVFAWVCGFHGNFNPQNLYAKTVGRAGDCNAAAVNADAGRYFAEMELRVNGFVCGAVVQAQSGAGTDSATASTNILCGANGFNSTERRNFSWYKGGFCLPADNCAYGYQGDTSFHEVLPF